MATLQEQLQIVQRMNLRNDLLNFLKRIENNLTTLNKEQLFYKSSDIFGKPIGYYSEATEEITGGEKRKGQPFTAVDTGDFLKGFYIKIIGDSIEFGSRDSKTDKILSSKHWLSKDLFGLTDESKSELIEQSILPFIYDYNKQIGFR